MPYVSDKQRKFFHVPGNVDPKIVKEYDEASKGKKLSEKVNKYKRLKKMIKKD